MWKAWIVACFIAASSATGWAQSTADDQKQRQEDEIDRMVAAGDYAGIERRIASDLKTQARFNDGMWKASFAYTDLQHALARQMRTNADWDAALTRLSALAKSKPHAWLMFSDAASARAWSIRGPGMAREVQPDAWQEFHLYTALATKVLDQYRKMLSDYPSWYSHRINMSIDSSEDIAVAQRLFDEGVSRHPRYHGTYYAMMRRLSPQWGGNRALEMDLLDQVSRLPAESRAEGMYARLIDYADQSGFGLMHDPRLDKTALRASTDAIAKIYPDPANLQTLFFIACSVSDRAEARFLAPQLSERPLPHVWTFMVPYIGVCKDWAEGRLEGFVLRRHMDGKVEQYLIR